MLAVDRKRELHRVVLASLALALGSCIEVPPPPAKDALAVKDIAVSQGVALETACTPTGPELCFNAKDDNCNGVIDEGCGLHTGILQFAIAWDEPDADVDLRVTDPTNDTAQKGKVTNAGLEQDRECPTNDNQGCNGQNVENVFLSEGEPKHGRYRVEVHLDKLGSATPPVKVRLSARLGQRSFSMVMELAPGPNTQDQHFDFTL